MPKINKSIYVILGTLSREPKTGYDIKKQIENSLSDFWSISYGQIYPTLKQLEQQGFISCESDHEKGRPERKVFKINDKGLEKLKNWLMEPIDFRNYDFKEYLLKLIFSEHVPLEYTIRNSNIYKEVISQKISSFKNSLTRLESMENRKMDQELALIAIKHAYMGFKTELEWCEFTLEKLHEIDHCKE